MKKHSILLCYLPSLFLSCAVVVFGFLIMSESAEATSSVYSPLLLCPGEKDTHNETGSRFDHPDEHWNISLYGLKHPPDEHQMACKSFQYPAGNAEASHRPINASFVSIDNNAARRKTPATSCATPNVTAQEISHDTGESNPPSSLKAGLLNLGIRGVLSSFDVIGDDASEEFQAYDVAATFGLPWGWFSKSGWGARVRLMIGAGAFTGGGDTGVVVSLLPLLAFGGWDGVFTLDMGAGAALFSRSTFGAQDFGGPFQYALTAGVGIRLFKRLGAGYRFMHYSDAGLYGNHTTGADLHMLEITCRFQWTRSRGPRGRG